MERRVMKFTKPKAGDAFTITAAPAWPAIEFETDVQGPHSWHWTIEWKTFKKTGVETTPGNRWTATNAIADHGGTLTVRAESGISLATISVQLRGTNPTAAEVTQYLATKPNGAG